MFLRLAHLTMTNQQRIESAELRIKELQKIIQNLKHKK